VSGAETTFIGIDLAWQSARNHSAIAVARGGEDGAVLVAHSEGITSTAGVAEYVLSHATRNTVVAIDAPLVLVNDRGQRPCEQAISRRFGSRHAGAHTTNRARYPDAGSVQLAQLLGQEGFKPVAEPMQAKHLSGCWFFEVYPHPAQVVLFDLARIIKYKKGLVAHRRDELARLRDYLRDVLSTAAPPLTPGECGAELLQRDIGELKGRSLKHFEDLLDSYFCAYLALFLWHWGAERNEVFGNLETGYIIVPSVALASATVDSALRAL
jgi:predicted RNase H-like nuclease